jgi:hypothetical protein
VLDGQETNWLSLTESSRLLKRGSESFCTDLVHHLMHSHLYTSSFSQRRRLGMQDLSFLFIQKIILSHWMLTLAILERDFNSLELHKLTRTDISENVITSTTSNLVMSRNLLYKCCSWIRQDAITLGIDPDGFEAYEPFQISDEHGKDLREQGNTNSENENKFCDLQLVKADWSFLAQKMHQFRDETDALIGSFIDTLQVSDSKRVNQLTWLGQVVVLVYTPFGCAFGILSMGDFAPGKPDFWVFWVVAIPLVFLTMLTFYIWLRYRDWPRKLRGHGQALWDSEWQNEKQHAGPEYSIAHAARHW